MQEVGGHPGQDHPVDAALAELQHEVVRLGPVDLVRARDHRLAVLDVGLVALEPVGAGAFEALEGQRRRGDRTCRSECISLLERTLEVPVLVVRVVVVGRDEDREVLPPSPCAEQGPRGSRPCRWPPDALADDAPGDPVGAEEVVLRIGDDQRRVRRDRRSSSVVATSCDSPVSSGPAADELLRRDRTTPATETRVMTSGGGQEGEVSGWRSWFELRGWKGGGLLGLDVRRPVPRHRPVPWTRPNHD